MTQTVKNIEIRTVNITNASVCFNQRILTLSYSNFLIMLFRNHKYLIIFKKNQQIMYPIAIQAAISTLYINSSENNKNILDSILICIVQKKRRKWEMNWFKAMH